MSSFISKQKIKVEEFLGAHKTKDSRFEKKKEAIINLEISMRNIKNMIMGLGASLTTISSFSKNFADELSKVYDKSCPFRLVALQIADSFSSVQEILKDIAKTIHGLQNNFKEWFVGFEHVKVSFKNYEEERRKYDHYSRKIDKLRQNRVIKAQKNQPETAKEIEKMQRNEKKYDDSKTKYEKILNDIIAQIQKILLNRFNLLNPVVLKLMVCQNDAADKLVSAFKPLENIESEFQRLKQQYDEEQKKKQEKSDESDDEPSEQNKTKREINASPDKNAKDKDERNLNNNSFLQESFLISRDSFANWGNNFANQSQTDPRMSVGNSNFQQFQMSQNPNQFQNNQNSFAAFQLENNFQNQQSFRGNTIQTPSNQFSRNNQSFPNQNNDFGDFNNFGRSNFQNNGQKNNNNDNFFGNFSPITYSQNVNNEMNNPQQSFKTSNFQNLGGFNQNIQQQNMPNQQVLPQQNNNNILNQQNMLSQQNMLPQQNIPQQNLPLASQTQNIPQQNIPSNINSQFQNMNLNNNMPIQNNPNNNMPIQNNPNNNMNAMSQNQNFIQNMPQNNINNANLNNNPQNFGGGQNFNMNQNPNIVQSQNNMNNNFGNQSAFVGPGQNQMMQQGGPTGFSQNRKITGNPFDDLI